MREPPDLRELVGEELSPEELARLHEVDSVLRRVPAPPHDVPATLTQAVAAVPLSSRPERRLRRLTVGLAFAAAVAAAAFAIGRWSGNAFEVDYTVEMAPTASAHGAEADVKVGPRDEDSGNVELLVDVSGLPRLPAGEDYALWLEKDGEWAATCGYFDVGEGTTTVRLTVSYDFRDFDAWVISTGNFEEPVTLLEAEIPKA
jgi:Anti-sigma-K factor rskA, C-terminal